MKSTYDNLFHALWTRRAILPGGYDTYEKQQWKELQVCIEAYPRLVQALRNLALCATDDNGVEVRYEYRKTARGLLRELGEIAAVDVEVKKAMNAKYGKFGEGIPKYDPMNDWAVNAELESNRLAVDATSAPLPGYEWRDPVAHNYALLLAVLAANEKLREVNKMLMEILGKQL